MAENAPKPVSRSEVIDGIGGKDVIPDVSLSTPKLTPGVNRIVTAFEEQAMTSDPRVILESLRDRGLSRSDIAKKAGVKPDTVSRLARSVSDVGVSTGEAIRRNSEQADSFARPRRADRLFLSRAERVLVGQYGGGTKDIVEVLRERLALAHNSPTEAIRTGVITGIGRATLDRLARSYGIPLRTHSGAMTDRASDPKRLAALQEMAKAPDAESKRLAAYREARLRGALEKTGMSREELFAKINEHLLRKLGYVKGSRELGIGKELYISLRKQIVEESGH